MQELHLAPSLLPAGPGAMRAQVLRRWLDRACLAALWVLLYLPNLGLPPLDHEEGRRFLPAREMLASGDFVVPMIFGRPYLAKPPLHYWLIDLASLPAGEVTRWSTRLPSALSVLALAWLVHALGTRHLGRLAGLSGAALWLVTPMALEKGVLGELEAPLALCVGLALAGQFSAARGRGTAAVAGGLALGLAVLAKGPAAWVFLGAAALGSAVLEPRRAGAHLLPAAVSLAISALCAGLWVFLLARRLGWEGLRATWSGELLGGTSTFAEDARERLTYVLRAALGFLPASALLLALAPRSARPGGLPPLVRFALVLAAGAGLFFLVYPRSKARYLFPAAPWVALAGGWVLARGLAATGDARARRALALAAGAVSLAGLLGGAALLADGCGLRAAPFDLDKLGVALALAMLAGGAAGLVLLRAGRPAAALATSLAVVLLMRGLHQGQVVPHRARAGAGEAAALAELATALPAGGRAFTTHWADFNLLASFPRPLTYTAAPASDVLRGDVLLHAPTADGAGGADLSGWTRLASVSPAEGCELLLLQRQEP